MPQIIRLFNELVLAINRSEGAILPHLEAIKCVQLSASHVLKGTDCRFSLGLSKCEDGAAHHTKQRFKVNAEIAQRAAASQRAKRAIPDDLFMFVFAVSAGVHVTYVLNIMRLYVPEALISDMMEVPDDQRYMKT